VVLAQLEISALNNSPKCTVESAASIQSIEDSERTATKDMLPVKQCARGKFSKLSGHDVLPPSNEGCLRFIKNWMYLDGCLRFVKI
jgi:hypothetical protein